jgi:hypothetical protein
MTDKGFHLGNGYLVKLHQSFTLHFSLMNQHGIDAFNVR